MAGNGNSGVLCWHCLGEQSGESNTEQAKKIMCVWPVN